MDGVNLLDRATVAGLDVAVVGNDLVIKGPRSCADLVSEIASRKAEIVAELRTRSSPEAPRLVHLVDSAMGDSTDRTC